MDLVSQLMSALLAELGVLQRGLSRKINGDDDMRWRSSFKSSSGADGDSALGLTLPYAD